MKVLLLLLLATRLQGQTLGAFEGFTEKDNATSWAFYDYATESAFNAPWKFPNTTDAEIYATFTQNNAVALFADIMSSEAYFVGDYTSAGVDTVTCEIFVEDASSFLEAEIYILAGGVFYYSEPYGVDSSGWSTLSTSFSKDQWYIYDDTENIFIPVELTDLILSDVTEIGINYFPSSTAADGKIVALDNFGIFPDLDPPALAITTTPDTATLSFIGIPGIQYTLQSSSTLLANSWSQVGAVIEITGLSETNVGLESKKFFRVQNQAFYVEVP